MLESPEGLEINLAAGDQWQGVYWFDDLKTPSAVRIISVDPIRLGPSGAMALTGPSSGELIYDLPIVGTSVELSGNLVVGAIDATTVTIAGNVQTPSVHAKNVTVKAGAKLWRNSGTAVGIVVDVDETLILEPAVGTLAGGTIDVTGRGYGANQTDPAAPQTDPSAVNPRPYMSGGSHIGQGGLEIWGWPPRWTYGSVYHPQEPGSGGESSAYGRAGGGVVRITAKEEVVIDGEILANGMSGSGRGGAGGSVWITSKKIRGGGKIKANGGAGAPIHGGGGAIAVEYTDATSALPVMEARTGVAGTSVNKYGGPGSIYEKGPTSTYGKLTIDSQEFAGQPAGNTSSSSGQSTELPSLGSGLAKAQSVGAILETDRAKDIPQYFVGHWVEIRDRDGKWKGAYRIKQIGIVGEAPVNYKKVMLESPESLEINLAAGDTWQGFYQFDAIATPRNEKIISVDPIIAPGYEPPSGEVRLANHEAQSQSPGSVVDVFVDAADAHGLSKIVLKASGPVVSQSREQTDVTISANPYSEPFQITVDNAAAEDSTVTIWAEIYDNLGTVYRTIALQLPIVADTTGPVINSLTITPASSDDSYPGGTALHFTAAVTDNVGVTSVRMTVDGTTFTDVVAPFEFDWTAPAVSTDTPKTLEFQATDSSGNASAPLTKSLTIVRASSSALPVVVWSSPSANGEVPAGYELTLTGVASDDIGIVSLELYEGSPTTSSPIQVVNAPDFRTKSIQLQKKVTMPAAGNDVTFVLRAYDVGMRPVDSVLTLAPVSSELVTLDDPSWSSLAGLPGVVRGGTLYLDSEHHIAGLFVLEGGSVKPVAPAGSNVTPVDLTIDRTLWVELGGAIDASGTGYAPHSAGYGMTWPETYSGGAYNGGGGSHGGRGGDFANNGGFAGAVYGSVFNPGAPGAAGGSRGPNVECTDCSTGGGVVAITAERVVIDGTVAANGNDGGEAGGAAGGSIWIRANEIAGRGRIGANGGTGHAAGGGGRVSLDASSVTIPYANLSAFTGDDVYDNWAYDAAPGTVHVRNGTQRRLIVAGDRVTPLVTVLPSLGSGSAGADSGTVQSGGTVLTTGLGSPIPSYFVGHFVEIRSAGALKGVWRIASIDSTDPTKVLLTPESGSDLIALGDTWRGAYYFDSIETSNAAKLSSGDPIYEGGIAFTQSCVTSTVAAPVLPGNETVWFDDALPLGAIPNTTWAWVSDQKASGTKSLREALASGMHQYYFNNASTSFDVEPGDTLFVYALIDPCNPPREILFHVNDGSSWEHRAFWGDDVLPYGVTGQPSRRYLGALPMMGKWIRLEVPAWAVGTEGAKLRGMGFTLYGGQVWFDRAGKIPAGTP